MFVNYNILDLWKAKLAQNISATTSTITLKDVENLPESNFIITFRVLNWEWNILKNERVFVATRSWNVCSWVVRWYKDSVAKSFDDWDEVMLNIVSEHILDIQNELENKANISHTHSISQITGLQTALNSKLESWDISWKANLSWWNSLSWHQYIDGELILDRSWTWSSILRLKDDWIERFALYTLNGWWLTYLRSLWGYQVRVANSLVWQTILDNWNNWFWVSNPSAKTHIVNSLEQETLRLESIASSSTILEAYTTWLFTWTWYNSAFRFQFTNSSSTGTLFELINPWSWDTLRILWWRLITTWKIFINASSSNEFFELQRWTIWTTRLWFDYVWSWTNNSFRIFANWVEKAEFQTNWDFELKSWLVNTSIWGWTTFSLSNNWVAFGSSYWVPRFYKDAVWNVSTQIMIKNWTWTVIWTLPAWYRPTQSLIFEIRDSWWWHRVTIDTSWQIILDSWYSTTWVAINISFSTR